jgi:hypothetical protein
VKPGTFFAELNRRNVYKVAIAYAVVTRFAYPGGINPVSDIRSAQLGNEGVHYGDRCQLFARILFIEWASRSL